MSKYAVHRVDANAEELYEFLMWHGVAVAKTPDGPLDVILAIKGVTAVADVKSLKGELEPRQVKFLKRWPGLTAVLRTTTDCLELIGRMREKQLQQMRGR